jgi:hypothetical protein
MLYNTAATRKGLVAKFTRRILFGHWQELLKSEMSRQSVEGYNHDQTELFNHERLKDYIYWFTKFGSAEQLFGHKRLASAELHLQDLDRKNPEILRFGHPFPPESKSLQSLFDAYDERAGDYFCRRYTFQRTLPKLLQFPYQAIFSVEGNRVT